MSANISSPEQPVSAGMSAQRGTIRVMVNVNRAALTGADDRLQARLTGMLEWQRSRFRAGGPHGYRRVKELFRWWWRVGSPLCIVPPSQTTTSGQGIACSSARTKGATRSLLK